MFYIRSQSSVFSSSFLHVCPQVRGCKLRQTIEMAVSHTLLLEEQLTKVEIETPESWFYFLVRSQHHWVITVIHVRSMRLPEVREQEITVCDSWGLPCCSEASEKEVKSIRKFYNAQFESGEWINSG